MRRKFLAGFLSLCLALSLLPMSALAVGEDAVTPAITGITVQKDGSTYTSTRNSDGSLYMNLPGNLLLAGATLTVTTNTAVNFNPSSNPDPGELYVATAGENSVGLNFNLTANDIDLNGANYRFNLTTTDHITWTGTIGSQCTVPVSAFLNEDLSFQAGSMVATNSNASNPSLAMAANLNGESILMVGCAPNQALVSVNYTYGTTNAIWKLPVGAPVVNWTPVLQSGQTFDGWYTDENHTQQVDFSSTVAANGLTLYGAINSGSTSSDFLTELNNGNLILNIDNEDDWASFVANASRVSSTQRVELNLNIDCQNASYTSLTFSGNFDGNGKTISNASFTAVDGNSGMFASIGPGQKVCNLVLENVNAKSASTYAGVLAGKIAGSEGNRALVQNIQVKNGSAVGRSAAGIAGFVFWADVKYCSSRGTTITGVANGGGIAGISYGSITDCYSTASPTALLSSGRGGIAGKNLEGGLVSKCWCTYSTAVGTTTSATTELYLQGVGNSTDFTSIGLDTDYWTIGRGSTTDFKSDAVTYPF